MHKIRVRLENSEYDILIGNGILGDVAHSIAPLFEASRILIVTNPSVDGLYGSTLRKALESLPCDVLTELIPEGEEWKNLSTFEKLIDRMAEARLDRKSLLVALGGGVVGDIAGFAAATFMRGIPYVQVPTTLLAQVDSSIGGKVGVDHQLAKNLVGSFYQPALVCIDPAMLASLPDAQVRNGVAEIIKYGMIADEGLFMLLERQMKSLPRLEPGLLEEVIRRCCQIKARIVQQDVRETTGLRMILNYGHTIGHAVEAVTGYTRFSHGEAIAIGMTAAAKIARIMDLATEEVETRQRELLSGAGLPIALTGIETAQLIEATLLDKKATGGRTRFVIPLAVGKVVVKEGIPVELVEQALHELKAR
jgi:3-dehydroquinate synthase